MDNIEVPEYFICPISLQIMKDPVTAISGITYDRESIEHWLFKNHNTICPVSKQALPRDSDLTPNHTLRRLIQGWCTLNASHGIDQIPTPKPTRDKFYIINLIRDLCVQDLQIKTLQKLEALALEHDRNRVYMVEAGLGAVLVSFIISCYKTGQTNGLEEALGLFYIVRKLLSQSKGKLTENDEIFESLMWVMENPVFQENSAVKFHAAYAVKITVQKTSPSMLERLKPEFFRSMVSNIRQACICQQGTTALLHALLDSCPWGRNRLIMVESSAVTGLIDVELRNSDKKTTELVLGILCHLTSCADGRAQLLNHADGVAVVTRRILKVSPAVDDRAVTIIWQICRYSGTNGVIQELFRVGIVPKFCLLMQADREAHIKDKVREILRTHYDVWKESPPLKLLP
ncbi:E3 ubiquitin-protein ligase PUB24-like isoform X1 [Primulina huaijiensis]|uniref:E3 ubiquitin-protein ligase PUB24-like isoform X1 n=1 Tax=Primulina huaijiensis TaxID=1492673 RepID=UPI003CC740BC